MVKKAVTIFFIFIFTTQALPIKQVGRLISKSMMTEEFPDCGCSAKEIKDAKWFHVTNTYINIFSLHNDNQYSYIHFSETLPFHLASEVQTPPPNIFC